MINYYISNKILSSIQQIYSVWSVIENASIVPEWEQKLLKKARVRSGVFSTRIEGSQISLEQAEKILQ